MTPTQTSCIVSSGDVDLFVRMFGFPGKTPLLILHGANYFDSADWIDVAEQLARDREVAAFDARGFGKSTWSAGKYYGYATALDDMKAVLQRLRWPRAIIIGHSRGGSHALVAAARAPDITAGLVLVDYNPGFGFGPPGGTVPSASAAPTVFPTIEDALAGMTRYKSMPLAADMRERALQFLAPVEGGFMIAARDPSFLSPASPPMDEAGAHLTLQGGFEELARIRCPALVIRATKSPNFKTDDLNHLRSMDKIDVREIDSGHDVIGEAPGKFVKIMTTWLSDKTE